MGSVLDFVECPRCKFEEAMLDCFYKTGEEYLFCERCGFTHKTELVRNKNGDIIFDKDKRVKFTEKTENPTGAFAIQMKGAIATTVGNYSIKKQFLDDLKKQFSKIKSATYTERSNGIWYQVDFIKKTRKKHPNSRGVMFGKK